MMNNIKRLWALCLNTHMELALYKYAIIIIVVTAAAAASATATTATTQLLSLYTPTSNQAPLIRGQKSSRVQRSRLNGFGRHWFAYAAPSLWTLSLHLLNGHLPLIPSRVAGRLTY